MLALAVAAGAYALMQDQPTEKRGSAREEFVTTEEPEARKPPKPQDPTPWPTYSYDNQRSHVSPFSHRPPYRRMWRIDGHDTLEFPPTVGYNTVFQAQQKGLFFALNPKNGRVRWRKDTGRCAASSPTLGKRTVYQAWMDFVPCPQARPGANGYLIAWDAKTGRTKWKWNTAPIESSPLLVGNRLYVGTWDRGVYALNATNGKRIWRFAADEEVNTSAAYWKGTIFIASDAGTLYALNAKTGRMRWQAGDAREFYYATPTVAYGRVFIGSTDGTMYVYGAKSGRLLWAKPLGSYIYGAAGVWKRKVYVGTYDGFLYALDAATGDVRWKIDTPGAVHAAPTIMRGLVYYAICSSCGSEAQRTVDRGRDATIAVRASNGKQVWRFPDGKYANPVVADHRRIYITGQSFLHGLKPRKARRARR